jgi:hypothetical protein
MNETTPTTDEAVAADVTAPRPEAVTEPDEPTRELATHGDPTVQTAEKRAQLLEQVRGRRTLRWVPASELLRRMAGGAAELSLAGADRTQRLRREAFGTQARQRKAQLGRSHPIREASGGFPATRMTPGIART